MAQPELSEEPNIESASLSPPPEFAAACGGYLRELWSDSLARSLEAALLFYRGDGKDTVLSSAAEGETAASFRRILISEQPQIPENAEKFYFAVVRAVWQVLRNARKEHGEYSLADRLIVALRPVRRCKTGMLTVEICAVMYDCFWHNLPSHLTKAERYHLEDALALTLGILPPDEISAYWDNLQSKSSRLRLAMRSGLKHFSSVHAVPHLLRGLEASSDHEVRASLVDILEQIAEPSAIPTLTRLRRETAATDWTLSRQIGRALRVIEKQNRGHQHQTLLRPSDAPPATGENLLRPAHSAENDREQDRKDLLRSSKDTEKPD